MKHISLYLEPIKKLVNEHEESKKKQEAEQNYQNKEEVISTYADK